MGGILFIKFSYKINRSHAKYLLPNFININKSHAKYTGASKETYNFPPHRLSDISIAIHSNSIAGSVHNRFAVKQMYCEHDLLRTSLLNLNE